VFSKAALARPTARPVMNSATHQINFVRMSAHAQQRLLAGCLLASVVLHALVFVLVPSWIQVTISPPMPTLELVIVQNEPETAPAMQPARPPNVKPPQRRSEIAPQPRLEPRHIERVPVVQSETLTQPAGSIAKMENPVAVPAPAATAVIARVESTQTPPAFNAAYLRNPPPRYPPAARRNGSEGTVLLKVLVSAEGVPLRVELDQSSGSLPLDSAALDAVKGWRFVPAKRGAKNIEDWVRVPIVFRLES